MKQNMHDRSLQNVLVDSIYTIVLLLGAVWIVVKYYALYWPFATDDAYITLRYALHWAEGYGIVWNIGEQPPVEGYSNFLFLWLAKSAFASAVDPLLVLKLVSAFSLFCSAVLLFLIVSLFIPRKAAVLAPAFLLQFPGVIHWSLSGLETATYQFISLAAFSALLQAMGYPLFRFSSSGIDRSVRERGDLNLLWLSIAGLLVFLAGITRPEGPIIGVLIAGILISDWWRRIARTKDRAALVRRIFREFCCILLIFFIPYAVYFYWRFDYFGRLLPNTVYCKMAYDGPAWALDADYVLWTLPAILFAIYAFVKNRHLIFLSALMYSLLYMLVLYGADPIIGYFIRHFLAAYALLLVPASVGVYLLVSALARKISASGKSIDTSVSIMLLLVMLLPAGIYGVSGVDHQADYIVNDFNNRMQDRLNTAGWLNANIPAGGGYVIGDAGMIPYASSDLAVIDLYCLNNAKASLQPYIGSHDAYADLVLSEHPEAIVLSSKSGAEMQPRYEIDGAVYDNPYFSEHYRFMNVSGSASVSQYHYWIFLRKDLLPGDQH